MQRDKQALMRYEMSWLGSDNRMYGDILLVIWLFTSTVRIPCVSYPYMRHYTYYSIPHISLHTFLTSWPP